MIFLKKCYVNTTGGVDCIPITHEVRYAIRDSTLPDGLVSLVVPDGGAGLVIVEPLPAVLEQLKACWAQWVATIKPEVTTNDARKRSVGVAPRVLGATVGSTLQVPFAAGQLLCDVYADILLVDFDPVVRRREVILQVMGEAPQPPPAPGAAPARPRGGGRG